ncbi:MAG TPA: chemotaxis protein CheX [Terriglobales bacterium]|nr:chemotaxis protein CheX [Terriglobales bacterium]
MNAEPTTAAHPRPESWLPILELSAQEVFEIMLGCQVEPVKEEENPRNTEFTAMVGLAGALCGILTVCCGSEVAGKIATRMLGPEIASSEGQVWDALGEICNMIAGNFKNKLAGMDGRCMLSVPTVVTGGEYSFHSLADGDSMSTVLLFEGQPVTVRLELHS